MLGKTSQEEQRGTGTTAQGHGGVTALKESQSLEKRGDVAPRDVVRVGWGWSRFSNFSNCVILPTVGRE